jgi:type IV pilus assembly protein PilB
MSVAGTVWCPYPRTARENPSVLVAMVDPENLEAQDDLNRILRPKNLALKRMVITVEDYQRMISSYLDEAVAKQKKEELDAAVDVSTSLEELELWGRQLPEKSCSATKKPTWAKP